MHSIAACLIALAFGFFGSMPLVGPIALMVVSRAARRRFAEALRIGIGAALAEGIYAGTAFWGFATFLARHAGIVPVSRGTTAVVLVGLGLRFVFWRPVEHADKHERTSGTILLGFSVSMLNPTLLLTWSTAVAFLYSKGLGDQPALTAVPFGASAAAGIGGWMVCFVALLRRYEGKLPRAALAWTIRTMGLTLVGLGVWSGVQLAQWLTNPDKRSAPAAVHASAAPYRSSTLTCFSWRANPRT